MKLKNLILILIGIFVVMPQSSLAQEKTNKPKKQRDIRIYGRVVDSFTNLAVLSTKITLMSSDSIMIDTCTNYTWNEDAVHPDAYFYMQDKLSEGTYIFKIEHPDYKTTYVNRNLQFNTRNTDISFENIPIKRKGIEDKEQMLDEVVVKSTKIKMVMKGDTIVFNADAFKLPEGSMLDALIRQLPGATLNNNGEIFINGRKLDYLTLNGKDFFKGNNKQLIENLPNYTVKDLKVFEKSTDKSKAMGIDVEKKDYVMDVQLKKQYEKNLIANFDASSGTNSRYAEKFFALYFTPRVQASAFANINNINEDRKPGEKGDWDPTKLPQGQVSQKTVGFNVAFSNEKNTIDNNSSVSVSWRDTHNLSQITSESFLGTGSSYGRSISDNKSKNTVVNLENTFRLSKPFNLQSRMNLDYNRFDNWGFSRSVTTNDDPLSLGNFDQVLDSMFASPLSSRARDIGVNRQYSQTLGSGHSLNAYGTLYGGKALKSGDYINFYASGHYQNSTNSMFNKYQLDYFQSALNKDYRDRYDDTPSHSYDYILGTNYTLKLPFGLSVSPRYEYFHRGTFDNNGKYRLDRLQEWKNEDKEIGSLPSSRDSLLFALDINNSYSSHYMDIIHKPALSLNYTKSFDKNNIYAYIDLPLKIEKESLDYQSELIKTIVKQNNTYMECNINLGLNYNKYNIYGWGYSNVYTPNPLLKINRKDDSNPLAVSLSNPELKNRRINGLLLNFSDYHNRRFKLPTIRMNFQTENNAIANGFTYDPTTGVYTYKPENVKGNWYMNGGIYYSVPLDSTRYFTLDNNINYTYNHNVDLTAVVGQTSSVLSKVNNHWLQEDLSLNYQREGLRCSLMGQIAWRQVNSKRENFTTIRTYDYNYGMVGSYRFKFGLETGMDLKMFSRRGYSDSQINTNYLMCNAYLSQNFMKGKLAVKLEAYDLFRQLKSIDYQVNGQGKTETRFNTIPNYVMLHLIYKLNISGKK